MTPQLRSPLRFVCNVTTPAQLFHVIRRQMTRNFLKPLVLFTSKYLYHHRPCTSSLEDMGPHSFFSRVISDGKFSDNMVSQPRQSIALEKPENIKKVVLCSGQIFYALNHARKRRQRKDMVIVRLEQLAPFPYDIVVNTLATYPNAKLLWCQVSLDDNCAFRRASRRALS